MRVSGTGDRSGARGWRDRRGGGSVAPGRLRRAAPGPEPRRCGGRGAGTWCVPRGAGEPCAPGAAALQPRRCGCCRLLAPLCPGAPLCPSLPAPFPQPRRSPCGSYEPGGVGVRGRGPSGRAGAVSCWGVSSSSPGSSRVNWPAWSRCLVQVGKGFVWTALPSGTGRGAGISLKLAVPISCPARVNSRGGIVPLPIPKAEALRVKDGQGELSSPEIGGRSHGEGVFFRAGVHLSVSSPPAWR